MRIVVESHIQGTFLGYALVVTHKLARAIIDPRAERIPRPSQVVHPLEADPKSLGAGLAVPPLDITAQSCNKVDHFREPR